MCRLWPYTQPSSTGHYMSIQEVTRENMGESLRAASDQHTKISLTLERRGCTAVNWEYKSCLWAFCQTWQHGRKVLLDFTFQQEKKRRIKWPHFCRTRVQFRRVKNDTRKYKLFTCENHTWKNAIPIQAAHCIHRKYASEAWCVGPIYHSPLVYNISCSTEV